jgi:drug/metabolite transporter (DMT)-like permease
MFIFEKPDIGAILSSWAPLLYLGVVSGAAGYTMQILGQKGTDPTVASLILSLESVFAAVTGAVFLQETFNYKEFIGCVLVFGATVTSQIKFGKSNMSESLVNDADVK